MKVWTSFAAVASLSMAVVGLEGCPPVRAQTAAGAQAPARTQTPAGAEQAATYGQITLERLKQLTGRWAALLADNKTIVDTFRPFAFGSAVLAEEWIGDEQITSTVFYLVGSELRADHYCDYGNQPRYVAAPSTDPSTIELQLREATNLDSHPTHFHATTWHLIDATHMTQDWSVEGGAKGKSLVHLQFVKQE